MLFVGDFPGDYEDASNEPMTGRPGRFLKNAVSKVYTGPSAYCYALRCKPPEDKNHAPDVKKITEKVVEACRGYLRKTIDVVKPERIVVVGNKATASMFGEGVQLLSARKGYGWFIDNDEDGEDIYIPVFIVNRPGAALGNTFYRKWFLHDLKWALNVDLDDLLLPPHEEQCYEVETVEDAQQMIADVMKAGGFTYDIETAGRTNDKFFKLLCLAIMPYGREDQAYVIDHKVLKNPEVIELLRSIFSDPEIKVSGQYVKFDHEGIQYGLGITVRGTDVDVRLLRKATWSDSSGKLSQMAYLVGMGGHKMEMERSLVKAKKSIGNERKRTAKALGMLPGLMSDADEILQEAARTTLEPMAYAYGLVDRDLLLRYNALDIISTDRLRAHTTQEAEKYPHVRRIYSKVIKNTVEAITQMELWGAPVDRKAITAYQKYLNAKIGLARRKIDKYDIDPGKPLQVADLLYKRLGLPVVAETDNGAPSTAKGALSQLKDEHPVVPAILEFRALDKLRGTYAEGLVRFIRDDGRIHPNLDVAGAASGRTSCIAAGCLVKTQRGDVPIEAVLVGDMVWTHQDRWRRVTRTLRQGIKPVMHMQLGNGNVLTCTSDHRLLCHTDRQWKEARHYGGKQEVVFDPGEQRSSLGAIPKPRELHSEADRREARNTRRERADDSCRVDAASGAQSTGVSEILSEQAGHPEPNVREERRSPSQLEGCLRRRQGISHNQEERQASFCAPRRDDGGSGYSADPQGDGSPPHRQESEEQCAGQPGLADCKRPPQGALLTGEGQRSVVCTEVQAGGSVAVYDLTVEEDESFLVCGIFAHNCKEPNLQNIPRTSDESAAMARNCFVAAPGRRLVQLDYSQLEYRIAAMLSGDKVMTGMFQRGEDFHTATAKLIAQSYFGVHPDDITKEMRSQAKTFNFGLLFGMTDGGMSERMGCSKAKAGELRRAIMGEWKELDAWIKRMLVDSRESGFAYTMWQGEIARQRSLPMLGNLGDNWKASGDKRTAENSTNNTPVQGSASELCVASIVESVNWLVADDSIDAKFILPVHDSLMFDAAEDDVDEVAHTAHAIMTQWDLGDVPLLVDIEVGQSWGELKPYEASA